MSTVQPSATLADALQSIPATFRGRLLKAYTGLKAAYADGNFDACGLRAGRFCEVLLRWLQFDLTGTHTPFGTRIANLRDDCARLESTAATVGHESTRILMPRALNFLYTLRNKRGIGHEGGDVDANAIDAATAVRLADWCICELVRLKYAVSLEEAQAICDAVAQRQLPEVWEVFGKRRVLDPDLSYADQVLLLLYSTSDLAIPAEDLAKWTEHSNAALFRRDVLRRLHRSRLLEYDEETQMVAISPKGVDRVESEILGTRSTG
jgi:hypothetical protein